MEKLRLIFDIIDVRCTTHILDGSNDGVVFSGPGEPMKGLVFRRLDESEKGRRGRRVAVSFIYIKYK